MLYQDKLLGQVSARNWVRAWLAAAFRRRRYSDLELLAFSRHLQRDIGLEAPAPSLRPADYIWRK